MDNFRAAIKERMVARGKAGKEAGEEVVRYHTIEGVPEWGRNAMQKLVSLGMLRGSGEVLTLSEDFVRIVTVLDRLGLFE